MIPYGFNSLNGYGLDDFESGLRQGRRFVSTA
ncbi:hypothetical protein THIOKS1890001 [Thiocapsa sp. KS1]|nr:hypothetical protein THIOKS1890001 [Thiocapsa sp. KS1]